MKDNILTQLHKLITSPFYFHELDHKIIFFKKILVENYVRNGGNLESDVLLCTMFNLIQKFSFAKDTMNPIITTMSVTKMYNHLYNYYNNKTINNE